MKPRYWISSKKSLNKLILYIFKELKEYKQMTFQQIENIKKEKEIILKSHIEIIDLKITISEIKIHRGSHQ